MTCAGPPVLVDWLSRTLTDGAGAGQSQVEGARGGAEGRERECACASGGALSPSRRRERERFSRGKSCRGAGSLPLCGRLRASGAGGSLRSACPGSLTWERMQTQAQSSPSGASVSLFCPLMHLPILLTAVPGPPEGSCPPGSLAFAFVSLPEGCWYRPPPQVKDEGWWGGDVSGARPGLEPGRRWL